ncbi:hypothetical protein GXW74_25195 [Roseomonas eburnea]|uniref:DUF4412 domain-containing protein n=1 Tax=Neoroseomonas eburnea TaxID=1346889 RepID=A0A9X9XJB2_9PROT|nr:hypothetical protein [Neoroseomonas eburnea]MBR0683798.1 hypothetical protein [Neoroseomonas eburnea]
MRHTLAAALIVALPVAVEAQDRPSLEPTRDVMVTYRVETGGISVEMTTIWSASARLGRMNLPGAAGYVVADHANNRAFMVMEPAREVMDIPLERAGGFARHLEAARFTRGATVRVAGTDCTNWRYEMPVQTGEVCFTADGALLRSRAIMGGVETRMEATRVAYGPQDAAQFRRPEGYQTRQTPAVPQAVAPGGRPGTAR